MDPITSFSYFTELEFSPILESWNKNPFLYHYIIPFICVLFGSRYAFLHSVRRISLKKAFPLMETKHEKEFWSSLFYVLCLITAVTFGEMTTGSEPWRTDYVLCYVGWPSQQVHSYGIKLYYTFCFSFYMYSLILLFVEEKKKDFFAMALHHIVTMITIFLSGYVEHYRIGVCIMMLFDYCDIALEVAKLFNKTKEDTACILTFTAFVILWTRNRLYLYPFYILPSVVNAEVLSNHEVPYHKVHIGILSIIFFLQLYWSYFIVKKLVTLSKTGIKNTGGDPRDESK